jgi:NADH-quinone oxidoreductase subunit L
MYLLILGLPLYSAFLAGFFGKYLGGKGSAIITTFSVLLAFFLSFLCFYEVALNQAPCLLKITP